MQQLQAIEHAHRLQLLDGLQYLIRRQTELGFLAARTLPLATCDGRKLHPHAKQRLYTHQLALLNNQGQFGWLLNDNESPQSHAPSRQREPDVLAVLVTVADDRAAMLRQRHDREHLRFAACLKPDPAIGRFQKLGYDMPVLIDLDGVNRRICAAISQLVTCVIECLTQRFGTILKYLWEAHQHRPVQSFSLYQSGDLIQVYFSTGAAIG